ncbi:MAG: ankyrin repeat domain-containing protein, partial [Pirellulaceae bacterium]
VGCVFLVALMMPSPLAQAQDELEALVANYDAYELPQPSDRCESTALHQAASNGYAEFVRRLLDVGAKVNMRNDRDQTPLGTCKARAGWGASDQRHVEVRNILLEYDAIE